MYILVVAPGGGGGSVYILRVVYWEGWTNDTMPPVHTKHLYNICTMLDQRRRRWAGIVQMSYKCFVFAGLLHRS